MAKGGARLRSGPPPDPTSARSERRGYRLDRLPAKGYGGPVPKFPLPVVFVYNEFYQGTGKDRHLVREMDRTDTDARRERELDMWAWIWSTPQACAWSMPTERWRLPIIAMYVRTFVICEGSEATAADKNALHRFADQIGMTTAGLASMGWTIVPDLEAVEPDSGAGDEPEEEAPVRRLRQAP